MLIMNETPGSVVKQVKTDLLHLICFSQFVPLGQGNRNDEGLRLRCGTWSWGFYSYGFSFANNWRTGSSPQS